MTVLLSLAGLVLFQGCYSGDARRPASPAPERSYDAPIMGTGRADVEQLTAFFSEGNSSIDRRSIRKLARIYMEESRREGVNWDVAFCQMCLETGYLRFQGQVGGWQNNFAGLGATPGEGGATFKTVRQGVRAHIQHLKAYGSTAPLNGARVDPRFHLVERGSAPSVRALTGNWATDPKYGAKIMDLLHRLWRR